MVCMISAWSKDGPWDESSQKEEPMHTNQVSQHRKRAVPAWWKSQKRTCLHELHRDLFIFILLLPAPATSSCRDLNSDVTQSSNQAHQCRFQTVDGHVKVYAIKLGEDIFTPKKRVCETEKHSLIRGGPVSFGQSCSTVPVLSTKNQGVQNPEATSQQFRK